MSITLIITRSIDDAFRETGRTISLDEWLNVIERDPLLELRTEPCVAASSAGKVAVPVLPGQSELLVDGAAVPFLGYRRGRLVMKLTENMQNPSDPQRKKVAEVANCMGALICHNAGDEILRW